MKCHKVLKYPQGEYSSESFEATFEPADFGLSSANPEQAQLVFRFLAYKCTQETLEQAYRAGKIGKKYMEDRLAMWQQEQALEKQLSD